MSYLRLAPEAYDKLLEQDLKTAQMNICDYISYLRKQKTAAHKSVRVYVAAIRKFYSMNDVQLNWDKIHDMIMPMIIPVLANDREILKKGF